MKNIKKLIKSLEAARGNGTSMISLIIPPKDQVSRVSKMLADEYGSASNIKSRVNRLSVLGAITSVQQRLKLYSKVPTNARHFLLGEEVLRLLLLRIADSTTILYKPDMWQRTCSSYKRIQVPLYFVQLRVNLNTIFFIIRNCSIYKHCV